MDALFALWKALQAWLQRWLPVVAQSLGPSQEIYIHERRFRVLRQLGVGGYAFVYLCVELPSPSKPLVERDRYAVKKVRLCCMPAHGARCVPAPP